MAAATCGAFLVHYWLPFRWKEPWWIAASWGGAVVLLGPVVAGLIVGIGLAIFAVLALPIAFRYRLALVCAIGAALIYGRATLGFGIPWQFWPVFGAIFMFRLVIYLYDLRFAKGRPSLQEYLRLLLPAAQLLFPALPGRRLPDAAPHLLPARHPRHRAAGHRLDRPRHRAALSLPADLPAEAGVHAGRGHHPVAARCRGWSCVYLLYLRVSGQFHIIVGLLHLFGYDLPETHRRYLLASSLTDFWRRINIYWKDFMVKVVYFPVFFRLRKRGQTLAQVVATAAVFVVTWATALLPVVLAPRRHPVHVARHALLGHPRGARDRQPADRAAGRRPEGRERAGPGPPRGADRRRRSPSSWCCGRSGSRRRSASGWTC